SSSSAPATSFVWMVDQAPPSTEPGKTTDGRESSSLERIRRLERLEQERLDEKTSKEERRRRTVDDAKPSGGRNDLVDSIEAVTKYPLVILGIAWMVIAIVVLTSDLNGSASTALVVALFVLWAIALVEYVVRL